jgi:hypothetical protein
MADYESKRGKRPTHLYVDPQFFHRLANYDWGWARVGFPKMVLGMKIVICDTLPMQKEDFFVTA